MEARDKGSARTRARCGDLSKGRASMGACTDRSAARCGGCSSPVVASASWHQWPDWRTERKVFGVEGLDPQAIAVSSAQLSGSTTKVPHPLRSLSVFPLKPKAGLSGPPRRNNNFEASSRLLLWQAEQKHLSIFFWRSPLRRLSSEARRYEKFNDLGHKAPPHIRTKRRRKSSHFDKSLHLPAVEHFPNA